jgi:hypothetical protein
MLDEKQPTGEFFYLDKDGNKQDAELHNPILGAVDNPVNEKIMKPIRDRHRAKWLAEQKKQAVPNEKGFPEFNPSQPRGPGGRWGGGDGTAAVQALEGEISALQKAERVIFNGRYAREALTTLCKSLKMGPNELFEKLDVAEDGAVEVLAQDKDDKPMLDFRSSGGGECSIGINTSEDERAFYISLLEFHDTGKGQAKDLLSKWADFVEENKLSKMKLFANIDVGGYAWARYGFVTDTYHRDWVGGTVDILAKLRSDDPRWPAAKAGLEKALQTARAKPGDYSGRSANAKAIWVIADSTVPATISGLTMPAGKHLLLGSSWRGELNFYDEESMTRFNSYVGRKSRKG